MSAVIRPMTDVNRQAAEVLIREMGVVDAHRFLNQFRIGSGDYTAERGQWLDQLSLKEIVAEIKSKSRKTPRVNRST